MEGVLCRPISGFNSRNNSLGIYSNNDHLQYYYKNYSSIPRSRKSAGVRCVVVGGGKMETMAVVVKDCATPAMVDEKKNKKMLKKRSKLLKRLSENLAMLSLAEAGDGLFLDNQEWKEALLSQLKKLKSEQKELKKKMKEEKAKSIATNCSKKTKKTKTKAADCASTSSSSESSDSECDREVLDTSRLKNEINTQIKDDLQLQLPPMIQEKSSNQESSIKQDRSNILISLLKEEKESTQKKIEVCMGGKCKRSGAGALLEEFQKVAGAAAADVAVAGCKCMGKCRDGPNVRLVSPPAIDSFDHGDELVHQNHCQGAVGSTANFAAVADSPSVMARRRVPKPSYPLCIGVGLDHVSFIVSKFVGDMTRVV